MREMNPVWLRMALEQLAQATLDHADWQESILQTIVYGTPPGPDSGVESAQRDCRFNRWYFDRAPAELWGHPAFAALGVEHEHLHRIAHRLLRKLASDAPIDVEEFDDLIEGNARLGARLDSLRRGIEEALRNRDPSTGAADRAEMLPDLRAWRELAIGGVQQCCIVLMDVDDLWQIRDTHGPQAGDEVRVAAVRHLVRRLRPYDKVYRHAGDEFLIALPGADLAMGQDVIRRVRDGLASGSRIVAPGDVELQVTASFGLALLDPEVSVEESVERADQALLLAKTAGRDRAISWDPSVTTGVRLPRLQLENLNE